jgi:hypothetical protein
MERNALAVIGGLVAVAVALIQIIPGLLGKQDTSEAKPGPISPTEQNTVAVREGATAPGRPGDRPIRLRNSCNEPVLVYVADQSAEVGVPASASAGVIGRAKTSIWLEMGFRFARHPTKPISMRLPTTAHLLGLARIAVPAWNV